MSLRRPPVSRAATTIAADRTRSRAAIARSATRTVLLGAAAALLSGGTGGAAPSEGAAPALVVWAWERPEDLRFLTAPSEIAVQVGFVEVAGDRVRARGRRFPLLADSARVTTAMVHVQIDPRTPAAWTPAVRAATAAAALGYLRAANLPRAQVDFEVRRSQRAVLLDLLHDVRAGLPPGVRLSMTALASWCGEDWLGAAPVDEVVPMLFRMGPTGEALKATLAAGGDLRDPRCRSALAVSTDAPIARAPAGRRVYLFSPRSWTAADFERERREVATWGGRGD